MGVINIAIWLKRFEKRIKKKYDALSQLEVIGESLELEDGKVSFIESDDNVILTMVDIVPASSTGTSYNFSYAGHLPDTVKCHLADGKYFKYDSVNHEITFTGITNSTIDVTEYILTTRKN